MHIIKKQKFQYWQYPQVKVVQLSVNGREMRIIYQMPSKDWKKQFCMQKNQIEIRHKYVAWCQGETDGDRGTLADDYKKKFKNMLERLRKAELRNVFWLQSGNTMAKMDLKKRIRRFGIPSWNWQRK